MNFKEFCKKNVNGIIVKSQFYEPKFHNQNNPQFLLKTFSKIFILLFLTLFLNIFYFHLIKFSNDQNGQCP